MLLCSTMRTLGLKAARVFTPLSTVVWAFIQDDRAARRLDPATPSLHRRTIRRKKVVVTPAPTHTPTATLTIWCPHRR
jgi:hypothetical protein